MDDFGTAQQARLRWGLGQGFDFGLDGGVGFDGASAGAAGAPGLSTVRTMLAMVSATSVTEVGWAARIRAMKRMVSGDGELAVIGNLH